MPTTFNEKKKIVKKDDPSKYSAYLIKTSIVNDTHDTIEVFLKGDAEFSYLSHKIMDYEDAKVIANVPSYNFIITRDVDKLSFIFANDLEDSLEFLRNQDAMSKYTYDAILSSLRIYNRTPTSTISEKLTPKSR